MTVIHSFKRFAAIALLLAIWCAAPRPARADAMLQLFNLNYDELITKMPEIAEAGYTSLWLPPPTKGGSVFSVGYDVHDPFDLGDKDQRGTVRTRYGTKAQLLRAVEIAHRFGLRVYFDNIMNHRGFVVPGYDANTPTNYYPGLVPGDFHLQTIGGGFYRSWNNIGNWNNIYEIQNNPLSGLIDLAQENPNANFGPNYGNTAGSPFFIRQPNNREYYYDTNLAALPGGLRPFNGTNGDLVAENTSAHLIRAVCWLLSETHCDGFRLDAVKHVPGYFFGDYGSASANGYCGAIQTMFDYVHGYGNNLLGNGYVEGDDNRNSNYDAEATRNDALIFGEHLGEPPSYDDYLGRGMRLLDNPLRNNLNNILGNPSASLAGYEQRDAGGFSAPNRIMHAASHDNAYSNHRDLQNAYYFLREGIPLIYSDGYNQESSGGGDPFPRVAYAPYLGQFSDNKMPDVARLHGQLARGGTRSRWGDSDVIAFERYDYREGGSAADQTVVFFAMNDNFGNPGDISFDDGVANLTGDTFYECFPAQNSRGQGVVVGFSPGSVLVQHADSPGKDRACSKLLVRLATNVKADAENSKNDPNPVNRKVYVGSQALASGGGAIEFKVPSGGYVAYAYQWPEASRASQRDVITFRHNNIEVPRMFVNRVDGRDGDSGFNPRYPFKNRGSINTLGNLIRGTNVGTRTYAIDIPIVTNAVFDILVRPDASVDNVLVKMDGGMDLNSHMNLGSTSTDKRDNRPGAATDVFLGYEQALFRFRRGPEKFAATNAANNTVVSVGAETFHYTVGTANSVIVVGGGGADNIDTQTADWVHHDPTRPVTGGTSPPATQRIPLQPGAGQSCGVWVKVGYQFDIDTGSIYYTTDGANPEGSFSSGRGTTQVVGLSFDHTESEAGGVVDWWRGTIPAQANNTLVKYKIALYDNIGSPISDKDTAKIYGVTQFAITNFNPNAALVYLHIDRNTNFSRIGLEEGFHIVRARAFLDRSGKSSVFNTFSQTFYYDAAPPDGVIAFPQTNGTITSQQYGVVVRADSSVTLVEYNIIDSNPANDDALTGLNNGNGSNAWAIATKVSPSSSLTTQYPSFPQEFRFNYVAVPSGSNATISVRLKEVTTAVLTNRFRLLTRPVTTAAAAQTLEVTFPSADGQTLSLGANGSYNLVFRFSDVLTANVTNFVIKIDDAVQPRFSPSNTALYVFQDQTGGDGKNELRYSWTNIISGQHIIEVNFNGDGLALEAARFVNVNISGATVSIVQPPAADSEGRSPYQIILPSDNGVPLMNTFTITTETTTTPTNVIISFSTNLFAGGAATRDTNFVGNAARWDFVWSNIVEGTFTIRADALGGGTNSATRVVQVIYAPIDQFRLIAPNKTGDTFSFSIQTLDGRTYVIEYTDDLANPNWQSLPNVNGDGTVKVVSNNAPGVPQRFYRFRTL
ncbi:MAG TPA: alpha-amylase family glycosyl hydrolase [Verrucomicrobiae bacterium]|jgi:glycosidase